ncbi:hypothetical protein QH494_06160 [Sphingomonas sp. AR_OL41]|uniref:hypothetical protein n=1 Tax=Sphingomonas sp. AR_OL41 TaxID=3042729 RepID=UPI00248077EB|nr:hypothetical protein [Sphingomonas sp. AR_OL41]MDH7971762.1 hypothetical protein [Sphingomonas sp. AR_OL41]
MTVFGEGTGDTSLAPRVLVLEQRADGLTASVGANAVALVAAVDGEASARNSGDQANAASILAERDARIAGDQANNDQLGDIATRLGNVDEALVSALVQTAADRVATGQDRAQTAADRVATGNDRAATAADRTQTALDRTATGGDKTATAADRAQTGQDRIATGSDVILTHADVLLTHADAVTTSSASAAAVVGAATADVYQTAASVGGNVPKGAVAFSFTSGSGGVNSVNNVATFSGGTLTYQPVIYYDVVGGAVTNVRMPWGGLFIGTGTPTMPTVLLGNGGTGTITLAAGLYYAAGQGYWAVSADGSRLDRVVNSGGAPILDSTVPSLSLGGYFRVVKDLAQFGATSTRILWGIESSAGRMALGLVDNGQLIFDIHPTSRAQAGITAALAAATGGRNVVASGISEIEGGSSYGSPSTATTIAPPLGLVDGVRDASKRLGYALASDGTFLIGKYDTRLARAARGGESAAQNETLGQFITEESNQIVSYFGSAKQVLTTEGNNSKPKLLTSRIAFLSDRFRGVTAPYIMNYDGSDQRAMLRDVAYEVVLGAGQSLLVGNTTVAITTAAPYPQQGLKLTGGPLVNSGSPPAAATALILPLAESGAETFATAMVSRMLDRELPKRPNLRVAVVGRGAPGKTYAELARGTIYYQYGIDQITRIATYGSTIVRAVVIVHGEADLVSTTYEADLGTWQANYEADIRAITGQKEPVYFILTQTSSMRWSYATGSTAPRSCLSQYTAALNNPKIVLATPEYIFNYNDNLHIDAISQRTMGEYIDKAHARLISQGRDWKFAVNSITLGANTIDLKFDVPVAPIVLDTALCTDPGNYGFTYSDASGRTISSVAVKAGTTDTVRITLSGTIGSSAILDYAYSNGVDAATAGTANGQSGNGKVITPNVTGAGARGCLRDSDPAVSRFDPSIHLYNAAPAFRYLLN